MTNTVKTLAALAGAGIVGYIVYLRTRTPAVLVTPYAHDLPTLAPGATVPDWAAGALGDLGRWRGGARLHIKAPIRPVQDHALLNHTIRPFTRRHHALLNHTIRPFTRRHQAAQTQPAASNTKYRDPASDYPHYRPYGK